MKKLVYFVVALCLFAAPAFFAAEKSLAAGDPQVGATQTINILDINDFHGRITGDYAGDKPTNDATWLFGDKIASLRAQNPDGTVFASGGDNVSASLFTSFIQDDNPAIDALGAAGLDVSVVGNHEFDKGTDDLKNRIIPRAQWTYLADNVYKKGTTEPYFANPGNLYKVITKKGIRIGFVGSVTAETPASVAPANIKDVDFGDPVDAVNKQAKYLKDNNLADVIVALYHEGAGCSDNPSDGSDYCSSIDNAKQRFPIFGKIVNQTSPDVAAIITGHTHRKYVWADASHNNRIVMQTGCYAAAVGDITLNVNDSTMAVTSSSGRVEDKKQFPTPINKADYNAYRSSSVSTYPTVQAVANVADAAQAYADQVGLTPIASLPAPITRGLSGCTWVSSVYTCDPTKQTENRAEESSVGHLVADAMSDYVTKHTQYKIDLAVFNPGSLRTDALPDANGKFTYGNAVGIQPFANELYNVKMTGANLKAILEQQWQTDSQGQRPTRKYLALALSRGFSYTVDTLDPDAAPGGHVLTMSLNGKPIENNKIYNVLTTSFLSEGGDNFRAFTNGQPTDVGLVDTNVFTEAIKAGGVNNKIYPPYYRSGVAASGKLNANYKTGDKINETISHLNMFSTGAQQDDIVYTYIDYQIIGTSTVENQSNSVSSARGAAPSPYDTNAGYSQISQTIPDNIQTGDHEIRFVALPSQTVVSQHVHIVNTNPNPGPNPYPDTGLSTVQVYILIMLLLTAGGSLFAVTRRAATRNVVRKNHNL
ncbi:MAG: bifunctional metallophosphatase/5'-nucleotidase [Bifidobacteriaceae bacterium]|jgi:5'-nucleotidase|nr:bifunctional metallophosphatase/5'-nucleotidase [Bifidobacteriaceae bacterium]